jgi:uncharacterized repeat protein (TIGR04138 family)
MSNDLITLARSTKYPMDGFTFVQRGLEFTVNRVHGRSQSGGGAAQTEPTTQPSSSSEIENASMHVTGRDLCHGLRDFAIEQYGLMARTVLRRWNIQSTDDFGAIVFAMVEAGLMHKTDDDALDDFADVFDFVVAFPTEMSLTHAMPSGGKGSPASKID